MNEEKGKVRIDNRSALIIVDVQKDFTPGGALAVPDGDKIIPVINKYIGEFKRVGGKVFATRDWHPENHISFKERGGPWPPHCIQNTEGAQFHPDLKLPEDIEVVSKAYEPDKDAYSGFEGTDLEERLRRYGIEKVFICGLATDYCVKNTVLDAISRGFETFLLTDAIKGIDANPGDSEGAIEEMKQRGAKLMSFNDIEKEEVLSKKIEEIKGLAERKIAEISEDISQKVEETKGVIKDVVKKGQKKIKKSAQRAAKEAKKAARRTIKDVKKTVRGTMKDLRETFKKTGYEVSGKLKEALQNVISAVRESTNNLKLGTSKSGGRKFVKKEFQVGKKIRESKSKGSKVSPGRGISREIKRGKGGGKAMAAKKTAKKAAKGKKPAAKKSAAKKK
jgi:nicotinamidase-related amidase